ncbi:MAG: hypothetical protein EOL93_01635 [Epsilonproteobacteria bacterium]|nr:hypothetical protein [Campylobacterota bacterium]
MLMKKIVVLSIVSFNCWAAMPWETGWAMGGTSTYAINDKDNNQLLIECNDQGSYLYLRNEKRNEIKLGQAVAISVNNTKMTVPTSIDATSAEGDKTAWGNFIYSLSKSKTITINNKKFEPNNSEKLSDIANMCTAYDETDSNPIPSQNTLQQTTKPVLKVSVHYVQGSFGSIPVTVPILHLAGLSDKPFKVQGLVVNKGNCKVTAYGLDKLKTPMVYGEERTVPLVAASTCSTVLDIAIQTNLGNFAYTFK